MAPLTQKWRFVVFGLNTATFYVVKVLVTGEWGLTGGESAWVLAAIGWWILGLVTAPWFRPPRDALAAAVGSFLILATMDLPTPLSDEAIAVARSLGVVYAIAVGILALVAGWVETPDTRGPIRQSALDLSGKLAAGEILFGAPAIVSIFGFYGNSGEQIALVALWFGFALLHPYELAIDLAFRIGGRERRTEDIVGTIQRIDDPGIVRVSLSRSDTRSSSRLHAVRLPGGSGRHLVPLFLQTQETGLLGTGICVGEPLDSLSSLRLGGVYLVDDSTQLKELMDQVSGDGNSELVGFVVEGSQIGAINFELARSEELEEGAVVFCKLAGQHVWYQILDARTSEESFVQNPRGIPTITLPRDIALHDPSPSWSRPSEPGRRIGRRAGFVAWPAQDPRRSL